MSFSDVVSMPKLSWKGEFHGSTIPACQAVDDQLGRSPGNQGAMSFVA